MRAAPILRRRSGPFVISAQTLLLASGILALVLGVFTLLHQLHASLVDRNFTIVALIIAAIWLACIILAFLGFRIGVFGTGAIAFVEFGVTASTPFVSGPRGLSTLVQHEGLPVAPAAMGLVAACILTMIIAAVAWGNSRGRDRRLTTLPLLVAALAGAVLVILQATDGVHRDNFGSANPEDGAFAAAFVAALWLLGGLWIARLRRVGALMIVLATFIVWYSFIGLHLLKGGTTLSQVAARSGIIWAVISAAATVLAAASFLVALGFLALAVVRPLRPKPAQAAPAAQRANR